MSNGASVLAEPVRQFVDDVTAVLVELGRGSSPASTLERDAALEAQAIAASVIASDGRYSDTELRAFATALSPWFDSLRRATPQPLRDEQRLALLPGGAARRARGRGAGRGADTRTAPRRRHAPDDDAAALGG